MSFTFNGLLDKLEADEDWCAEQERLLSNLMKIRGLPSIEPFTRNRMFFLADVKALVNLGGTYLKDPTLGLFNSKEECLGEYKLWIPTYDFEDNVVGFSWWSDGSVEEMTGRMHIKYRFQVGTYMKERYLNIRPHTYLEAKRAGYLVIVDGYFDKYHSDCTGILTTSTYGSNIDEYKEFFLSFIDHLIVVKDNDEAGVKHVKQVQEMAKRYGKHFTVVEQTVGKDLDDYLKAHPGHHAIYKKAIEEAVSCGESAYQVKLRSLVRSVTH